jgi:hypothetical protein
MKYKLWLTVLTAIMMACGACAVVSEKDNPQEVINKARQAQKNAESYRARMTVSYPDHQAVSTLEYVKPNRYHLVDGNSEYIYIGEDMYNRIGPNWHKDSSSGHSMILGFDPFLNRLVGGKVETKFVGKDTLDGKQTLVYEFVGVHAKIWISPMDALPRKMEHEGGLSPSGLSNDAGSVRVRITVIYSDYNSGIKIEPPQSQ